MKLVRVFIFFSCLNIAIAARAEISDECRSNTLHSSSSCLVGETLISTPQGQKQLSDIRLGDEVLAMDRNGKIVKSVVTDLHAHSKRTTCKLRMSDGSLLRITPEHVVMEVFDSVKPEDTSANIIIDRVGSLKRIHTNYKPFELLGVSIDSGASLLKLTELAEGADINAAKRIKAFSYGEPEIETVYNIEVEKYHNYFANGVLVHNIK